MTFKYFKYDGPASIVVFLVALPLCLGVALASGAPLISGIIAGIIGGIVVGSLSASGSSVSGPAAGLTAVVLASITKLGSFEVFLTAVVLAGIIQVGLGALKAGAISDYIPSNVIKGLLAAIGVILILKQIPHAVGYDTDVEEDFAFEQADGENTFSELLKMLDYITPGVTLISIISILILVYHKKTPLARFTFFPASLLVVILGIFLNMLFANIPFLAIETAHLVNIPTLQNADAASYFHVPALANFSNQQVWITAFTIAIVASIETLLNLEAIDNLDHHKRKSLPNRELLAQGVGNMLAGMLGGIPVTSVIVRSSVNLDSGARTKLSTIMHGLLMLISVLMLTPVINMIPLASLAAVLIVTGYKLADIAIFKTMYKKGWQQFIPFVATVAAIVFTDLLMGIMIGLCISIFFLLKNNLKSPFVVGKTKLHIGEVIKLQLPNQVTFLNKATIKRKLQEVPRDAKVVIDATHTTYVDHDVLEVIEDFKKAGAPERGIKVNVIGLKDHYEPVNQIEFMNIIDEVTQQNLSPQEIFDLLQTGNERFVKGMPNDKYHTQQVHATSHRQHPMAVIVSCIDSRSAPEIIFDAGIGDLIIIRIAGNINSREITGSIELAIRHIGAKLIVVMGHSNCGAVHAAIKHVKDYNIGSVTSKIQPAIAEWTKHGGLENVDDELMNKIIRQNAVNSLKEILDDSPYLLDRVRNKEVGVACAYYDTASGKVHMEMHDKSLATVQHLAV